MNDLFQLCELLKYGISISRAHGNQRYCVFVHLSEEELIHDWGNTPEDACMFVLTKLREKHDSQLNLLFGVN